MKKKRYTEAGLFLSEDAVCKLMIVPKKSKKRIARLRAKARNAVFALSRELSKIATDSKMHSPTIKEKGTVIFFDHS